mgnify:FL=1
MKPEIKEKITATNQKYLKKFLTEEVPAKLESQLEHMDWSYLDMIHNKEQQRGTFSPLAAMELSEIEANKDKYLATGLMLSRMARLVQFFLPVDRVHVLALTRLRACSISERQRNSTSLSSLSQTS